MPALGKQAFQKEARNPDETIRKPFSPAGDIGQKRARGKLRTAEQAMGIDDVGAHRPSLPGILQGAGGRDS
jgi:hypothetical protein